MDDAIPGESKHAAEGEYQRKFSRIQKEHWQKRYSQPETNCALEKS